MTDSQPSPLEKIAFLQDQFRQQIPGRIRELHDLWRRQCNSQNRDALLELYRKTHSLAGSAGSFGAPVVSKKARVLELALKPGVDEERTFSPVEQEFINRALQALEELAGLEFGKGGLLTDPRLLPVELENRLIYVVEDDTALAQGIAAQLEHKGLTAETFTGPEDFELAWDQQRPAAIIMDVVFGEQGSAGIDMIESLRRREEALPPVIFMSVRDDFEARLQAVRLGASRYLIKPLPTEKVAAVVSQLLDQGALEDYRVLIVDDDATLAEYYAAILTDAGMVVEIVTEPERVLDAIYRFRPELVLMDVYIPGCSGLELAAVLRQDNDLALMPIIFLSSEERIDGQLSALNLGGDDFLTKPVLPAHLLQAVSARLKRARTLMRLNDGLTNAFRESSTLRKAMELHNLVSVTDLDGVITYANDKFCEVSGYSRAELIGKNHRIVNSGYHDQAFFREFWHTIAAGEIWRGTLCNRARDGHLYWVESTIIPFLDEDGLPYQYVSIRTDVTGLKRTEQQLAERRLLLNLVRNGLTRFVSNNDVKGVAEYMLGGLLKLTCSEAGFLAEVGGFSSSGPPVVTHCFLGRDDPVTARWRRHARNDIRQLPGFQEMIEAVLETGQPKLCNCNDTDGCAVHESGAGSLGIGNYACVPIWYGHEIVGVFGLYNHDDGFDDEFVEFLQPFSASYGVVIHGCRAREREQSVREQLIIAKESAEQASRLKSDFLSGVSHELRTPLNSIIGFSQLLESDPDHPLAVPQEENVAEILKAGRHLLGLIEGILDLAKIEAGRMDVNIEPVSVQEVLEDVLGLMRPQALRHDVHLHCDLETLRPLEVAADRVRLRQVLINLVSNAIKYNRPGGSVTINGACTADGTVSIEVSDTGVGMSPREIAELFIPFSRPGRGSDGIEGTGIGLVLSRNLVEKMGGTIEVSSRPDVGSCFTVSFRRQS